MRCWFNAENVFSCDNRAPHPSDKETRLATVYWVTFFTVDTLLLKISVELLTVAFLKHPLIAYPCFSETPIQWASGYCYFSRSVFFSERSPLKTKSDIRSCNSLFVPVFWADSRTVHFENPDSPENYQLTGNNWGLGDRFWILLRFLWELQGFQFFVWIPLW